MFILRCSKRPEPGVTEPGEFVLKAMDEPKAREEARSLWKELTERSSKISNPCLVEERIIIDWQP